MASVFSRGSKAGATRWYARYKDAAGLWRSRRTYQETKREAQAVARALQAQAERQRLGLERPAIISPACGQLMETWAAGLTNRSAADDRCRLRLHVLPRWRDIRVADVDLPKIMLWIDDMRASGSRCWCCWARA